MAIKIGDKLPLVTLWQNTLQGPQQVTTESFFSGRDAVVLAIPSPFTQAPAQGYVEKVEEFKAKGVSEIACIALIDDPALPIAWGSDTETYVTMLTDRTGDFARAIGLELGLAQRELTTGSQRYAMWVQDGVVRSFYVEPAMGHAYASQADAMLMGLGDSPPVAMGLEGNPKDKKG